MVYYTTDFFAELDEANDNAVNGDIMAIVNAQKTMPMANWQLADFTSGFAVRIDPANWDPSGVHKTVIESDMVGILIPLSHHGLDGSSLYPSGAIDTTELDTILAAGNEHLWFIIVRWDNTIKQWSANWPAQCVDIDMCARTKCPG